MTRFDAADPTERRKLIADAVAAHRTLGSEFTTVEADPETVADENGGGGGGEGEGGPTGPTWVQFAGQVVNLDCTRAEFERLKTLVDEFPEFRIDELLELDESGRQNVRITARSDANRVADFVDRTFVEVYGHDEDFRAWVVEI
jgi:hypothetical protein